MSQAIEARQVYSEKQHYSSSNVSKKGETQINYSDPSCFNPIPGSNNISSIYSPHYASYAVNQIPQNGQFRREYTKKVTNFNEPSKLLERNRTEMLSLSSDKNKGFDLSPIRRFEKLEHEQELQNEAIMSQYSQLTSNINYQSPLPNTLPKYDYNFASNSVSDSASKHEPWYHSGTFDRLQTQRIEGGYTERHNYSSGEDNKKYRTGSDYETKPHTQRDDGNITALSSLNSSFKKIHNFQTTNHTNYLPFVRPYSTLNLANRPDSYNFVNQNRPISFQEQNKRFEVSQDYHLNAKRDQVNLTALESEGIIDEEGKYMKTFVNRPNTSYQNEAQFTSTYRPQTNLTYGTHYAQRSLNDSLNLQQTSINRPIVSGFEEINISQFSEIPRPHYENKHVEKRTLRKLGGSEEPQVVFKNNWCLLALLLFLLLALLSVGVWFGRDSYLKRQTYVPTETKEEQPGVKPTYVNMTQITPPNIISLQNQTSTNQSTPAKPVQYPPIQINMTVVNPQIETRNDTILKPEPQKPTVVNTSVIPQEIPIVFPPVEEVDVTVQQNKTEEQFKKPIIIQPVFVPTANVSEPISTTNVTVILQTNVTEVPVKPVVPIVIPYANVTETNITAPIEPVVTPVKPVVNPIEPVITPVEPIAIQTNLTQVNISSTTNATISVIPPFVVTPNITQPSIDQNVSITVAPFQPVETVIEKEPGVEYLEAQKVNETSEFQGYVPYEELYFPIQQKVDYSIEPSTSNQFYPQIIESNVSYAESSDLIITPPIFGPGIDDISEAPSTSLQFNQVYKPVKPEQNISAAIIEPSAEPVPITTPSVIPFPSPTINPTINVSVIQPTTLGTNQTQQITWPLPTTPSMIEPSVVEPSIIQPSIMEPAVTQPSVISTILPPSQQKPSDVEYINPQNVSEFEVSVPPITSEVQFQSLETNLTISVQPSLIPTYFTQPQKIDEIYVPTAIEILPSPVQTGYSINPIATSVDFGTANETASVTTNEAGLIQPEITPTEKQEPKIIENLTAPPKPSIPSGEQYIEPRNISDFQISILPHVQVIEQKPQTITFVTPVETPTVQPQIQSPQTYISPQPIAPSIYPTFSQPQITQTSQFKQDNAIQASREQSWTIFPEILDDNALQPETSFNLPEVEVMQPEPIQQLPANISENISGQIVPATFVEPISISQTPIASLEVKPGIIQPQPILPLIVEPIKIIQPISVIQILGTEITLIPVEGTETISAQQIQPTTFPANIEPVESQISIQPTISTLNITETTQPYEITPIPVQPSQTISPEITPIEIQPYQMISPAVISPQPIQITPILPSVQNITSVSIQPTITPITPSSIEIVAQQIIASQPQKIITNFTDGLQIVPKTYIISETNFTDPDEFILCRVKRLTPIEHPEAIYQIPTDYDKTQLAQIQKNFLSFYNKTLAQKSPFQIIPLSWKALKQSTLLTETQYPIYYTHNRTEGNSSINYLPPKLPVKMTSSSSENKQSILQISSTGQMTVLQKGSDWIEVEKNIQTYRNSGIPSTVFPNVIKPQIPVHRHYLTRNF